MVTDYQDMGYACDGLHGDKDQYDRIQTLKDFKESKIRLLFATDVMARGIDVKDITTVINFDFPQQVGAGGIEEYVHRVGRTGRAGAKGRAITFFSKEENSQSVGPFITLLKTAKQPIPPALEALAMQEQNPENNMAALAQASKREAKKAQRKKRGEVRDGDWICSGCGANIFGSKSSCFKCKTPKRV
jgi:superfamily II DNA/RNA helicase